MKSELKGVHRVKAKLASGKVATYYYAWRGGPRIIDPRTKAPLVDPNAPEFRAAFDAMRRSGALHDDGRSVRDLITKFKASTEFTKLSTSSTRMYAMMLDRIRDEFGTMPIAAVESPKARGLFMEWRDGLAATPRMADYAWTVLARLFSVSKDRGYLTCNPCERGGRLYRGSRVDHVWMEADLANLFASCSPEVAAVVIVALWSGQRQGDVLRLPWSAYDGAYLRLKQGKTGTFVIVPVAETLKAVIDTLPRESPTMLLSSEGRPWTSDGFRTSFGRACKDAGVVGLTFHDLRGTAVTRLALAGAELPQIAALTGHSHRDVGDILDRHYLNRDVKLAEAAILKLETYMRERKSG